MKKVAEIAGVHYRTVQEWVEAWEKGGLLTG
ncbi:MAG: hypothetical protein COS88_05965 [Chloroflexi bacterium CG07_land_8_20_14_0_80_51_10]|nr:MAG: hypothetical protein COS88_05965 [Chloroflexi bacterium CG07_land_8_20_14_0_80_51_10]